MAYPDQSGSPTYLFVLTRDLQSSASAGYVLRSAMAQLRRGQQVVVYLREEALTLHLPSPLLDALGRAGARLLCDADSRVPNGGKALAEIEVVEESELARLLRLPGVQAVWC
jgi:hypothetical protein